MTEGLPTASIRRRLGSEDAHYGGGLVAGAKQLEIIGDLITELAMRYDGDEGLFRAYEAVGVFEYFDQGAETYMVRRKDGELARVPARGNRFGKVIEG